MVEGGVIVIGRHFGRGGHGRHISIVTVVKVVIAVNIDARGCTIEVCTYWVASSASALRGGGCWFVTQRWGGEVVIGVVGIVVIKQ